jgi:predicted nucleic acid-binding Zn ribbon protein
VNTLLCPHCQTAVSGRASVCRGCGAEIVRGARRRERSLTGVVFVLIAMLTAVMLLPVLEIARGAPLLPSPKAEDGLLFLGVLIAIVVVPYLVGTRAPRLFWRSRIRFYRSYQHQ